MPTKIRKQPLQEEWIAYCPVRNDLSEDAKKKGKSHCSANNLGEIGRYATKEEATYGMADHLWQNDHQYQWFGAQNCAKHHQQWCVKVWEAEESDTESSESDTESEAEKKPEENNEVKRENSEEKTPNNDNEATTAWAQRELDKKFREKDLAMVGSRESAGNKTPCSSRGRSRPREAEVRDEKDRRSRHNHDKTAASSRGHNPNRARDHDRSRSRRRRESDEDRNRRHEAKHHRHHSHGERSNNREQSNRRRPAPPQVPRPNPGSSNVCSRGQSSIRMEDKTAAEQLNLPDGGLSMVPSMLATPTVIIRQGEFNMLLDAVKRAATCSRSCAQLAEASANTFRNGASASESAHTELAARTNMRAN